MIAVYLIKLFDMRCRLIYLELMCQAVRPHLQKDTRGAPNQASNSRIGLYHGVYGSCMALDCRENMHETIPQGTALLIQGLV